MSPKSLRSILVFSLGITAASFMGSTTFAETCTSYEIEPTSVNVGWTAFKTTSKVGVNGSFKRINVKGGGAAKTLALLATGLDVSVDPTSVDTGNPVRDKTLVDFFFAKLDGGKIHGSISKVSEEETNFVLGLDLNGQHRDLAMTYTLDDKKLLVATGELNILDFRGDTALKSLNAKCADLHKGKDGVSKTWPDVTLTLKAQIKATCTK